MASTQLQAAAAHAAKWVLTSQQAQTQQQGSPQLQQQQQSLQELQSIVAQAAESASQAVAPFVWVDGPLVLAMRRGDMLLVDEINLAEDAVLERLNRCAYKCVVAHLNVQTNASIFWTLPTTGHSVECLTLFAHRSHIDSHLHARNSVLEPGRTLTLAERGGEGAEVVKAAPGFRILATMNPGGDYGKKWVCCFIYSSFDH